MDTGLDTKEGEGLGAETEDGGSRHGEGKGSGCPQAEGLGFWGVERGGEAATGACNTV